MDAVSNAIGTPPSAGLAELRNLCDLHPACTLIGCAVSAANRNGMNSGTPASNKLKIGYVRQNMRRGDKKRVLHTKRASGH